MVIGDKIAASLPSATTAKNENIWNIFFQFWLEKRNFAFFITRKVSAIKTGKILKSLEKNKKKKASG